jgi:hypothetical protein
MIRMAQDRVVLEGWANGSPAGTALCLWGGNITRAPPSCQAAPRRAGKKKARGDFLPARLRAERSDQPMAALPRSLVRMRMASSRGTMKIFPSPMLPVLAALVMAWTAAST